MNNRPIRIAKNNLKINDLVFEQQVVNTVANVVQLYWTLVSAIENVEVAQQAVKYSQRLLEDNQKQVAVGTLAPVEVTRARAELAADTGAVITGADHRAAAGNRSEDCIEPQRRCVSGAGERPCCSHRPDSDSGRGAGASRPRNW